MNSPRLLMLVSMLLFSVLMVATSKVSACPICRVRAPLALAKQVAESDAAVLVRWVETKSPEATLGGSTTFSIIDVSRGPKDKLKQGDKITISRFLGGMKGDLFFLMGETDETDEKIEWNNPLKVTDSSYRYIVQAPSPETPKAQRLEYFLKFLEASDPLISKDAYEEFTNASYEDIVMLKDKLERAKICQWITNTETPPIRLTLYGRLLGLCGNADDAVMLRTRIGEYSQEFRLGLDNGLAWRLELDGLISGYLLLTGAEGLDFIDEKILKAKDAPFAETYAAMQALRFMWTHGDGRISQDRLRQSIRELLDRPYLADLVIADLGRWKDWSVQDRLMKLYGTGELDLPIIKRAIVRFLLTMEKSLPPDSAAARETRQNIDKLRVQDPKTFKDAEKFFSLQ